MGYDFSMSQNLNTLDIFWMNQVQMRQSIVGRWRVEGGEKVCYSFTNFDILIVFIHVNTGIND